MSQDLRDIDHDDFFQETRMSFGDHLEDLRIHLWRAIKGFFIACILGFIIGKDVLVFIAKPVEKELQAFYDRRAADTMVKLEEGNDKDVMKANKAKWVRVGFATEQLEALLKRDFKAVNEFKPADDDDEQEIKHLYMRWDDPVKIAESLRQAVQLMGKRPGLQTLSVSEAFVVYMKVSLATGFVFGAPWIFYQIWSFIAVGLYPHEKRLVNVYMPFSLALFVFGVIICEFFVIPKSIEALLWFNEWIGLEPDMRLNEWLGFAIIMPVIFGLTFQLPLFMMFVYRVGLFSVDSFRGKRRLIWFFMAVFAAVITPSTDPYSMMFLWVPMCLLFELGIYLCLLYPQPKFDDEIPDTEEVIEV